MKELLMIFTHNPILDKASNGLHIEEKDALENYLRLLKHMYSVTKSLSRDKYIFYDSYIPFHNVLEDKSYEKFVQLGFNKEEKMLNAFIKAFTKGYDSVVLINTASSELTSEIIDNAFIKLQTHDHVMGFLSEGGFYLMGMKKLNALLFECDSLEKGFLQEEMLKKLKTDKSKFFELPVLRDTNKEEDLFVL